ncbi:MAG: PQQ-binding-like beta-propeller repeat protein [Verrucomicrobiota bacterium]
MKTLARIFIEQPTLMKLPRPIIPKAARDPIMLFCISAMILAARMAHADDWPQFRGPNRDAVWQETNIIQTFPKAGLVVRWRVPVGYGLSSPVVAQGRVYLIDAELKKPKAQERVHCWDEKTGASLWTHVYDVTYPDWAFDAQQMTGPNSTVIVQDSKLFAIGATGQLLCLDAVKGAVLWERQLTADYGLESFSGITPSLLIEGNLLTLVIGGKPDACVVALEKSTGKEVWRALSDKWTHSSPIVINAGGQRQLIVWTPDSATALNPATGETWWRQELTVAGLLATVPTPVLKDDLLLFSGMMLQLDAAKPTMKVLWPTKLTGTQRILSQSSIPIILGDHVFSGKMPGGKLVCLEALTGKQVWETDKVTNKSMGSTIHLTPNGDSVLIFTDEGNLIRARLTPQGYEELSRVHVIDPVYTFSGRKVVWPPPAYANQHIFVRDEAEMICASLEVPGGSSAKLRAR